MTDTSDRPAIPALETVVKDHLAGGPPWMRRFTANALAILSWVGLPWTVLSTISDLQFVLDAARWLWEHAGLARPLLEAAGEGVHWLVRLWRAVTHPLWAAFGAWLHLSLPAWALDAFTLATLVMIGTIRRSITTLVGSARSAFIMARAADQPSTEVKEHIPRGFPYRQRFAECGVQLRGSRLRYTEKLWKGWRRLRNLNQLLKSSNRWPRFPPTIIRQEFERYWLAAMDGRRELALYLVAAGVLAIALAIDAFVA